MKVKYIFYVVMITCIIFTILAILKEDDKAMLFGMLGTIGNGIQYLDAKIEELKK